MGSYLSQPANARLPQYPGITHLASASHMGVNEPAIKTTCLANTRQSIFCLWHFWFLLPQGKSWPYLWQPKCLISLTIFLMPSSWPLAVNHDKILLQTSSSWLPSTKLFMHLPVLVWFIHFQQCTAINLCTSVIAFTWNWDKFPLSSFSLGALLQLLISKMIWSHSPILLLSVICTTGCGGIAQLLHYSWSMSSLLQICHTCPSGLASP